MIELPDDQRERLERIVDSADGFIEEEVRQIEAGKVKDTAIPSSYGGSGSKARSAAIGHVYLGAIPKSREMFRQSADLYLQSSDVSRGEPWYSNAYRRLPMTLTDALYGAALSSDEDKWRHIATEILALDPTQTSEDAISDLAFHPDKYYLSVCLAGAALDSVDGAAIESLQEINAEKPDLESLYGNAISKFASGIDESNQSSIASGIESALSYHKRTLDQQIPFERVMDYRATAMVIIARGHGYEIEIESDLLPGRLIDE